MSITVGCWVAFCAFVTVAVATPVVMQLEGNYNELFFWYTRVRIGGASFTVTVDTGSSDLLVPALGCNGCIGGNATDYYNVRGHAVGCTPSGLHCTCGGGGGPSTLCDFNVTYGGALTLFASAVQDRVTLIPGISAPSVLFGATYNVSQPQQAQRRPALPLVVARVQANRRRQSMQDYPEGMWGMAFASINALGTAPMLDTLVASNHLRNSFAMCMRPVGGVMHIGGPAPAWGAGWAYTPVTSSNGFWQPTFESVSINGKNLGFPSPVYNTPGIVDSGTPFTTLPVGPFGAFKALLRANCSANALVGVCGVPGNATIFDGGNCFTMTAAQRAAYPVLQIALSGAVTVALEPAWYLMSAVCGDASQFGLGIVPDPTFTVIGGNAMLKYAVAYDKDRMRVGFSQLRANEACK